MRYIFVTGGVVSSIGKGIAAASLGRAFVNRGYRVTMVKTDPYVNVDAGTMNPLQHGEVFVTKDGAETDLDLGNYERFLGRELTGANSITTGKVYDSVLKKEREGRYLGECVQIVPHIVDEIKRQIRSAAKDESQIDPHTPTYDLCIVEIGGTVGDIESQPFLEAARQMKHDTGSDRVAFVHVTLVPDVGPNHELKTKPTQHSVQKLREVGIVPDALLLRAAAPISDGLREKISLFCDVAMDAIIPCEDAETIYEIPLLFEKSGFAERLLYRITLDAALDPATEVRPDLDYAAIQTREWKKFVRRVQQSGPRVKIALVGKYVQNPDAYTSIVEALRHAGAKSGCDVEIVWIDADKLSGEYDSHRHHAEINLSDADAVLVPGGFGSRGTKGKRVAIQYARERGVPFLGICYGMQLAAAEYAENVLGYCSPNSTEIDPDTPNPVIHLLPEQEAVAVKGGSMRLGNWPCDLAPHSLAAAFYGGPQGYQNGTRVKERHRHRYEFNTAYRKAFQEAGMCFSGTSRSGALVEVIELRGHPFFIGCQFHPEYRSTPLAPHPLFMGLLRAAKHYWENRAELQPLVSKASHVGVDSKTPLVL